LALVEIARCAEMHPGVSWREIAEKLGAAGRDGPPKLTAVFPRWITGDYT